MNLKEINIKNRRATFDYAIGDTFTAGIVLTGTEIKALRMGKASLADTYVVMINGEAWVKNMYIAEYFYGTYNNHEARRDRKLLLTRKELAKLEKASKDVGFRFVFSSMTAVWRKLSSESRAVRRNTISVRVSRNATTNGR